jgi:hypothetical protein
VPRIGLAALLDWTRRTKRRRSREQSVERVRNALAHLERTTYGDSNDDELDALRDALELALTRWPEITEPVAW